LRAGEFVRVYVVARRWRAAAGGAEARADPFWTTLATLVVERVLDSLAIVLILAALILTVPVPRFLEIAALVVLAIDVAGGAVLAFVGLGVSIPSAPGYVGVFHAAAALAVGLFGVAQSTAVGYALLFHASQILPVTLLGWLYLVREQMSLSEAVAGRPAEG